MLVLECGSKKKLKYEIPKFAVGGPKGTIDPRRAKVSDLVPFKSQSFLAKGWSNVHNFVFERSGYTDECGWQYRSDWPTTGHHQYCHDPHHHELQPQLQDNKRSPDY